MENKEVIIKHIAVIFLKGKKSLPLAKGIAAIAHKKIPRVKKYILFLIFSGASENFIKVRIRTGVITGRR